MMTTVQGRREVAEAVLTAALCTIAAGLAQWSLDAARERSWRRARRARKEARRSGQQGRQADADLEEGR